jgi:uncharacterized protein YcaQ
LPIKAAFAKRWENQTKAESLLAKQVLDRIEREGPLMVGDFENDRTEASSGWWDWRPAKIALEHLYLVGHLMICRTPKFQKLYDLPLNLVPYETDLSEPTPEEFARFVIRRTLGALGIGSVKEMAWRARYVKHNLVKKELPKMIEEGLVQTVTVEGLKGPFYVLPGQLTNVELTGDAFILSPFDILNVFRHRLRDFFDFDYQVECFVPAPKRKYGYFSLPILIGETFVARMDSKADRKNKVLIIHNLHFEDVALDADMLEKLTDVLKEYVLFNGCRDVSFAKCNRPDYLDEISRAF